VNEQDLKDLLTRELKPVLAPEDLWARIEAAHLRPSAVRPKWRLWAVPALALAASACFAIYHVNANRPTLTTGQGFVVPATASVENAPVYEISQARTTVIGGEPVRHLVFTPEDRSEAISLFISASKVTLPSDGRLEKLRTVQFPCSKQMCTIVCRKCSAKVVDMLSSQLAVETPNYQ
jgi:hypothetical protein